MPVAHRLNSRYGNRTLASHNTTASLFNDSFLILREIMPYLVRFDRRQWVNKRALRKMPLS
jgi:hypothetical protein